MLINDIYSLSTGLKNSEGYILEDFLPVDFNLSESILINTSVNERAPSKTYDYFQLVCWFLKESFPEVNLVQISDRPSTRIPSCNHHLLNLKPGQAAYLIARCKGILTGDDLYSAFAGKFKTRSVGLYGSTSWLTNNTNSQELSIKGKAPHPTYQAIEQKKNINTIEIENIYEAVSSWIIGEYKKADFVTRHIGEAFLHSNIEVIPDSIVNPQLFPEHVFTIRMDYLHDEVALERLLQTRKYNIVASEPISPDLLKKYRGQIGVLNYELREDMDLDYCKKIKSCGVKTLFFTRHQGEKLKHLQFRMLDIGLIENIEPVTKRVDLMGESSTLRFKTTKYILSHGKIYLSHAHYKSGIDIPNFSSNDCAVIDDQDFWKDLSYFYIYEKINK